MQKWGKSRSFVIFLPDCPGIKYIKDYATGFWPYWLRKSESQMAPKPAMTLMIPRRDLNQLNLSVFMAGGHVYAMSELIDSRVPGRQINKDLTRDKNTPDFGFGALHAPDFTLEILTHRQPNTQPKKTRKMRGDCRP